MHISYSWVLNRSTTDHCNHGVTSEWTWFFLHPSTWGRSAYFTFAIPHIHYRDMSYSYSTPIKECKTYRDHVLLYHHERDSVGFNAHTWRYHHLPYRQRESLLSVLFSSTLQLKSLMRLAHSSSFKKGLKCNKQISHLATWRTWSVQIWNPLAYCWADHRKRVTCNIIVLCALPIRASV